MRRINRSVLVVVLVLIGGFYLQVGAQPVPGDVFREYTWYNEKGDAGYALRVGGGYGQKYPDRGWAHDYINAPIVLEQDIDLDYAIKAEVVIEKILCHDNTRGLALEINGHEWLEVPEAPLIPYPQWDYQHHFYPIVQIPLSFLKNGVGNQFRVRVSQEHSWKWPQNLINGVHFRIYYDPVKKPHPQGRFITPESNGTIGQNVDIQLEAKSPNGKIKRVDYIGFYEDVNFEGDGNYRQWHYHYLHGELVHHIGTVTEAPFDFTWDTSWIPDQLDSMQISARITDRIGLIYMPEPVGNLVLERRDFSVELCKPYNVPPRWVTRNGKITERFDVRGDVSRAMAAQLVWSSWSPGYMNGIYINEKKVFDNEGPKYEYYAHRVNLQEVKCFKQGVNILQTGMTGKVDGKTVHGMEVNWPGIMVLIKYQK